MNGKVKNGVALSIVPQIVLVKWLAQYPQFIETYYSQGVYPMISHFSRTLFGWIPFSIGDIGYTLFSVWAVRYLITKRSYIVKNPKIFLRDIVLIFSVTYFAFHLLWGLNYYRLPVSKAMGLKQEIAQEELVDFVEDLIEKTNEIQFQLSSDSTAMIIIPYTKNKIFEMTIAGYTDLEKQVPFLAYDRPSLKKSLYSTALTYMGYGGYLNPFTNEAQVNGKLPNFRFPVVSGHEIGHQLGYSAENETNFIGYLATATHKDPYFKYSAYTYALSYCLGDIRQQDEAVFQKLYGQLNVGIKKNFQEMAEFWEAYENPMEPVFKSIFNSFLKANNQAAGIKSYNLVVSLLVAYHQEHPL